MINQHVLLPNGLFDYGCPFCNTPHFKREALDLHIRCHVGQVSESKRITVIKQIVVKKISAKAMNIKVERTYGDKTAMPFPHCVLYVFCCRVRTTRVFCVTTCTRHNPDPGASCADTCSANTRNSPRR